MSKLYKDSNANPQYLTKSKQVLVSADLESFF